MIQEEVCSFLYQLKPDTLTPYKQKGNPKTSAGLKKPKEFRIFDFFPNYGKKISPKSIFFKVLACFMKKNGKNIGI